MASPGWYPIRWRKSGFGTQRVPGRTKRGMTTGYVKIWFEGRVVDRALTVRKALQRVRAMEQKGPLLWHL